MGLFNAFKKKTSHEEKVALAYRCYKAENVNQIFPNGIEQADIIIKSLAEICKITLDELTATEYYDVVSAYSDVFIRINITKSAEELILKCLQDKHPKFIKDEDMAQKVLVYCKLNMQDNFFLIDAQYKIELLSDDLNKDVEFYFENMEEFLLYSSLFKRTNKVVWLSGTEYTDLYKKGYDYFEQGQYKNAVSAFCKCLKLNPVGISARFELVECFIMMKSFILAEGQLRQIKDFLYNNNLKARFYRRFGFISTEKGLYDRAYACYKYSLNFENHISVNQELKYIESKAGSSIRKINDIKSILVKYDVPVLDETTNINKTDVSKKFLPVENKTQKERTEKSDIEIYKRSSDGKWLCVKKKFKYYFLHKLENEKKVVKTPGGNLLETSDEKLAERILADLEEYGTDYMGPISILPWQYTYRDSFYTIPQGEIVKILDECFLQKHDWTFDYRLENVFGFEYERKSNIKTWFEKCSPGQLVAACCIGNAYHSVNVAYVLALLLENYSGDELDQQFDALAKILETQDYYIEDCYITFKTFEFFYKFYERDEVVIGEKISVKESREKNCSSRDITLTVSETEQVTSVTGGDYPEKANEDFSSDEEKYGAAWLKIVSVDKVVGLKMMKDLDRAGFVEASVVLAMFSEDSSERKFLYKKAAIEDHPEGLWGYCCHLPRSFCPNDSNSDDRKWLDICTKAANLGCADAMNELGNVYHRRKQYPESMYWYAMANAHDHPDGKQSMQGIASEWLKNGKPYCYDKDSEHFNDGKYKVSVAYLEMWASEEATVSIDELIDLVLLGEPLAAYFTGDFFEEGEEYDMAYKMYNAIAFEDDPHGIRCCADMLFRGLGEKQDKERAIKLYKRAADLGERTAMFIAGEFTKQEEKNIAAYWYGKAHVRGYNAALNRLIQLSNF